MWYAENNAEENDMQKKNAEEYYMQKTMQQRGGTWKLLYSSAT